MSLTEISVAERRGVRRHGARTAMSGVAGVVIETSGRHVMAVRQRNVTGPIEPGVLALSPIAGRDEAHRSGVAFLFSGRSTVATVRLDLPIHK
jgi:hypothetical protein